MGAWEGIAEERAAGHAGPSARRPHEEAGFRGREVKREVEEAALGLAAIPDLEVGLEVDPPVGRGEPEAVVERIDHAGRNPAK